MGLSRRGFDDGDGRFDDSGRKRAAAFLFAVPQVMNQRIESVPPNISVGATVIGSLESRTRIASFRGSMPEEVQGRIRLASGDIGISSEVPAFIKLSRRLQQAPILE